MQNNLKMNHSPSIWQKIANRLHWTRTSYAAMSTFILLLGLIGYVWRPLVIEYLNTYDPTVSFWLQFDWLLLGIFLFMSLLIMADASLVEDFPIVAIGLAGGLVIESWGTQTELWTYYTLERPPLWIIPAWPIASLSIDRLYRWLRRFYHPAQDRFLPVVYWGVFILFYALMLWFVAPTFDKSLTLMALFLCAFLILTPTDKREAVLVFLAGSGLGYFLERWGTTRLCWVYYTQQTPPLFAVLAHGMAAVAFWRVLLLYRMFLPRWRNASGETDKIDAEPGSV
jgi:hypothetical protein